MFSEELFAKQAAAMVVTLNICGLTVPIQPAQFVNLCSLTRLENLCFCNILPFSRNMFAITTEIVQLTNLRTLELSSWSESGELEPPSLPAECCVLKSLRVLRLYCVQASFSLLTQLSGLTELALGAIDSTAAWPKDLGGLVSLADLELRDCLLGGHLYSLSTLTVLTQLCIMNLEAAVPPAASPTVLNRVIGLLTSLVTLDIASQSFTFWLGGLSRLSKLTSITAFGRQIHDFNCCASWVNLACLDVGGCSFAKLPGNLAALTALTKLDISYQEPDNFQVPEPLAFMSRMPRLQQLTMHQGNGHKWSASSLFHLAEAEKLIICSHDQVWFFYLPSVSSYA